MQYLILFFKGFIVGLGKVIPGVSGSILAILLGIYDKCLNIFGKIPRIKLKEIIYLSLIFLGILIAILFFSNVLMYYLRVFPAYTMSTFLGLVIGTVPNTLKNTSNKNIKKSIFISLFLGLLFSILSLNNGASFRVTNNYSYLIVFLLGVIEAFTSILPGISGTAIFISLGCYEFILGFFANPFKDLYILSSFSIGYVLSFYLFAKLINYLFKNKNNLMWNIIIILLFTSILTMLKETLILINIKNVLVSSLCFTLGLFMSLHIPNET